MAWTNVHKWIVRYSDNVDANIEEFDKYVSLESFHDTKSGNSVFHLAVLGKSSAITNYLIENAPRSLVNQPNEYRETPLHWACRAGNTRTISLLLKSGADIDSKDLEGNTPLHFAVEAGNYDVVQLMTAVGANINATNDDNVSVLSLACIEREMKIIRFLVEKGAECYSVLSYYIILNDPQIVKNIVSSAELERCVDKFNHNPLHVAVIHNKYKVAKVLLKKSLLWIKAKNRSGKTPADLLHSHSDKRLRGLLDCPSD